MEFKNNTFRFLKVYRQVTVELLDILKKNIIGTPGISMLYQHMQVEKKVRHIADPWFVFLEKGGSVLGTCCFCAREVFNFGTYSNSYYLRYFTLKNQYRTSGKSRQSKTSNNKSLLKKEIEQVLIGNAFERLKEEKFYNYAYVDPNNLRSALLCSEFGFQIIRQFRTIIFNRINPSPRISYSAIKPGEIEDFKIRLLDFYKNYSMFSFENLFSPRLYYVVRDENRKIIAGVQAETDHWQILELPGIAGKIILALFSNILLLKKLISSNYRFLTLEGIFYEPGKEEHLQLLFESLLSHNKLNSAMLWLDVDSELYKVIESFDLGLVAKLKKPVVGNVICRFQNFDQKEIESFRNHPSYISGTDLT